MLQYLTGWLTGWLVGVVWWRKGCMEGRECVEERGQGCFPFSQLIDSQMSGGAGVCAGAKVPCDTLPLPQTNITPMHAHAGKDCANARTHPCASTCGLTIYLSHIHLFSTQICLWQWDWGWLCSRLQNKSQGIDMIIK